MNLYRLQIDNDITDIIIESSNKKIAKQYIEYPGDIGYKLYEILSAFHEYSKIEICENLGQITDNDTIIRYHKYAI